MSETQRRPRIIREAIEPYVASASDAPFVKLSISLPADLVDVIRATAAVTGSSVSAMIAAAIRRTIDDAEQRRLDAALQADAEENLAWAAATAEVNAKLIADLEW